MRETFELSLSDHVYILYENKRRDNIENNIIVDEGLSETSDVDN